ncbi:zinc finger and BTB domain-containing protein 47-like [Lucilia cuprina]|uniref:zinc finger and BTB domain-containing protein 47-like n=1 Tax=Lucilia cuprina TaxID=7375 RepID=UPI001F055573|nr:zinc finger and BTB domain-containing protein 47-like [Lucilia cuprina]
MCDTAEDMDEYIEYEFARDCIEIADDCEDIDDGVVVDNDLLIQRHTEHLPEETFLYEEDDEEEQQLEDQEEDEMHDYEIVEELDEDVEQLLICDTALDIKAEVVEPTQQEEQEGQAPEETKNFKDEFMDQDVEEDHLIDEDTANGFGPEEEFQEVEYEEVGLEEEQSAIDVEEQLIIPDKKEVKQEKPKKPPPQPCPEDKGPKGVARKYMLYDELVATIVDYDPDGTPIVEFSVSNNEADEKLPMECGICPDVMSRTKITAHLKTHLVPGTNRYQCIYCEETYKDCKYLAGHARRHMGIRPYVCELCKLYFSTKQDLRVHNQRRHQEKDHICEVCGKTFAQNTQLKRHREATHEKKRRFKCDLCPKSYYKNFSLQEHIRAVHMGKRRIIVCPFCGMQCRDAHKMARHRKQYHLHQTHFECHICNEEFTDINYFDAHKRSIQCRNNTRRKLEEEGQQQQQQQQEEQQLLQQAEDAKQHILNEDDSSQQYSQHSNEHNLLHTQQQQQHPQQHLLHGHDDDEEDADNALETVQIIDECDYKHLITASPTHHHHQQQHHHTGQFMLNNDLLQHHKIEEISPDDVADDEELVYEITIDSNE